jgi:hypothetical protein
MLKLSYSIVADGKLSTRVFSVDTACHFAARHSQRRSRHSEPATLISFAASAMYQLPRTPFRGLGSPIQAQPSPTQPSHSFPQPPRPKNRILDFLSHLSQNFKRWTSFTSHRPAHPKFPPIPIPIPIPKPPLLPSLTGLFATRPWLFTPSTTFSNCVSTTTPPTTISASVVCSVSKLNIKSSSHTFSNNRSSAST